MIRSVIRMPAFSTICGDPAQGMSLSRRKHHTPRPVQSRVGRLFINNGKTCGVCAQRRKTKNHTSDSVSHSGVQGIVSPAGPVSTMAREVTPVGNAVPGGACRVGARLSWPLGEIRYIQESACPYQVLEVLCSAQNPGSLGRTTNSLLKGT